NRRMRTIAVSPDGRWLAVGGWNVLAVRVWDLHRRRLERTLRPTDGVDGLNYFINFSPDGRWLASCTGSDAGEACHFWRVGSWACGSTKNTTGFPCIRRRSPATAG